MEAILTVSRAAAAMEGEIRNCGGDVPIRSAFKDSRNPEPGGLFFALVGDNFDGHSYVDAALQGGAVCCVVNRDREGLEGRPVIAVQDTRAALRQLAAWYRRQFPVPSVGITGSVGKTSTKEIIASVLAQRYQTLVTPDNKNNEIGLPFTVFGISAQDEILVLEMGMNHFGEISNLTRIATPDTAVITNIGLSHIEYLGSREGIRKAKFEIFEGLQMDGTVILNGDDDMLWGARGEIDYETLYYGIRNKSCDLIAEDVRTYSDGSEFSCRIEGEAHRFILNVPGEHHIYNALAAILVGLKYNVDLEAVKKGIKNFTPGDLRQKMIEFPDYTVIRDCYNASPASMKSGLEVLSLTQTRGRRVACLADMLELGEISAAEHFRVGQMAVEYGVDCLVTVGRMAREIARGAMEAGLDPGAIHSFDSNGQLKPELKSLLQKDDVILVKGSRGMRMEEIADAIGEL